MSINFKIYLLILLFLSQQSLANFVIDKEYCTLSKNFSGKTSDDVDYQGVINLTFTSSEAALPLINISGLSRSIDPTDMSLSWPNADLLDSQNRPIFLPDFQSRITTEINNSFNLVKETEGGYSIFYSRPYGFYRFQNLIALLLSQNSVRLKFKNINSNFNEQLDIELTGSDIAFREITRHCFANSVSDYIAANYSRTDTNPVHYVWSIGYGLTSYFVLEDLLPSQVKFPNDLSNNLSLDSRQSYVQFDQLYQLLKTKLSLTNSIREIELNETYRNAQSLIRQSADQLLILSNSREAINGPRGQLAIIDAELSEIEFKIKNAENFINLFEQNINPLFERKKIIQNRIEILSEALNLIQQRILASEELNEDYINNIKILSDVIVQYAERYESQITSELQTEALASPYSLEVVLESNEELLSNQRLLLEAQGKLNLILAISDEIKQIVELFVQFKEIESQRSSLLVQKVGQQQAYEKNLYDQVVLDQVLGFLSFDQIDAFLKTDIDNKAVEIAAMNQEERQQDANLKISDLITKTEDQIAELYSEYKSYVDLNKDRNSEIIFLNIVCKTDFLNFRYQGRCLNPIFMSDSKKIEIFIDELDSETLGNLYFLITGVRSAMNNSAEGASRVQTVSEKIFNESQSQIANEILNKWKNILYVRWKYNVFRVQDRNTVFTFDILQNALKAQQDESNRLKTDSDQILAEIVTLDLNINSLTAQLNELEGQYFNVLDLNQAEIIREINSSGLTTSDLNIQCLISITSADVCYEQFNLVQNQITTLSDDLNSKIDQTILFLLITAKTQIGTLNESLKSNMDVLNSLIAEKDLYIQENNYNQVSADFQSTSMDVRQMQLRLKQFAEQQADASQRKLELTRQRIRLNSELENLVEQIDSITEQIRPTLLTLKPICDEKIKFINDFENNERAIYALLSLPEPNLNMNSICQIKFE